MENKYVILSFVIILFLTIGFSAFNNNLLIDNIGLVVRKESIIRVTNVIYSSSDNGGVNNNIDYNVSNINGSVTLPNSNSSVTYTVVVTNIGNVDMGILDVSLPSNLDYTTSSYTIGNKLCDDSNSSKCNNSSVTTFNITIKYKSGATVSNEAIPFTCVFNFKQYFDITYDGFSSVSGLPTGMMETETKNVTFTNTTGIPSDVGVIGASGSYSSPTLVLSNATGDITVTRNYSITYVDFTGDTSGLPSSIAYSGGTITFTNTSGVPSSVNVSGASSNYSGGILTLSNITGDITITASSSGGGSGTPGGTDVIENEDGSTTTITYDENGNPAEATNEITDSSGNTTTQEITYVNGEEVVTGYSIDTSNNSDGGLSVPSEGIDTGVLAFDGNDFVVTLKATFAFANCTATICPIINVTKKNTSVNGVLIYEDRIATSGYGHDSSGTNVNPPYNKFRIGKYVTSAPTGSVDYNIISKITSTQGNGRYGYNSSSTPVTLTIKLYYTSGVFTSEIYDSSGATDVLLAKPYNNTTLTFSDTGTDFDNITIQLGTFESGTTTYPTHNFEIIDFDVTKTVN